MNNENENMNNENENEDEDHLPVDMDMDNMAIGAMPGPPVGAIFGTLGRLGRRAKPAVQRASEKLNKHRDTAEHASNSGIFDMLLNVGDTIAGAVVVGLISLVAKVKSLLSIETTTTNKNQQTEESDVPTAPATTTNSPGTDQHNDNQYSPGDLTDPDNPDTWRSSSNGNPNANPNANNGPPNSYGEYGRPDPPYSGGGNNGDDTAPNGAPRGTPASDHPADLAGPGQRPR